MKLPSEWEMKTLGELGTCHIGLTYKPDNVVPEGGALVLRSSNIQQSRLVFDDNVFVNMDVPSKLKVCYGDILICVRNGSRSLIGKSAVIEREHAIENLTFGAFMSVYRTDHHDYVRHLFHSDMYYRQIRNNLGATINQITNKNLNNFTFPFPKSSAERNKISEVLSTIDKKIDLIDQKIAETEKLKTGLMQKLFSEGVGVQDDNGEWQPHTEFQDNGLPMHWSFLKLGSVAKVTSGGTPSRKKASFWENGTIPWITTGEVNFNCITNSSQKITDEGLKNSAAKMFPPDTILMAMYGQGQTRGRVAMLGIEASTNQACAGIICSKKLNPHFCYHYLSSQYEKIRTIGNEGSQKNLNGQIIKDILIPCPNLEEQEQIALVLSTVDEKITLLAKQKSETQKLKKGLMQKLLTGEWRVPVEETEAA
ncbi:restriction endonuclease subunit S [Shewanella algae]|uniref:restriction endonuclease subunit S n=1 Tax=Shewanella algae TaxID=38313 RepID=UPI0031F55EA9